MLYNKEKNKETFILRPSDILENMSEGLIVTDLNGYIIHINRAMEKLWGYNRDDVIGKSSFEITKRHAPHELEKSMGLLKDVVTKGTAGPVESKLGRRDGLLIPISMTCSIIKGVKGRPVALSIMIRDISHTKTLEQKIEERTAKLEDALSFSETLFDSMIDGVSVYDMNGRIKKVNKVVARRSGYREEELIGKEGIMLTTKEDAARLMPLIKELLKKGFVRDIEATEITRDGNRIPISANLTLMRDANDKPTGIIAVSRDVSRSRKLIAELEKARATLKESVMDRTSELEAAKTFSENILNSIVDGVTVVDMDGKIKKVNAVTVKRTGYTEDELIGMDGTKLIAKEDIPKLASVMKEVVENGFAEVEITELTKGGRRVPLSTSLTLLRGADGNPTGVISTSRDISHTKKMIKELQDAKKFSEGILDSMADSIIVMNPQGYVIRTNKAHEQLFGYNQEKILGTPAFKLIRMQDADKHIKLLKEAIEKGKSGPVEVIAINKDGREIPVSATMSTIKDEKGKVQAVFTVSRDITERKKAEDAIRESEEKLKSIFDAANDVIIYLDTSGNVIAVNKRVEELFGYKLDELIGRNIADIGVVDPKELSHLLKLISEAVATGKVFESLELTLIRKDGTRVPVDVSSNFIKKDGKITGIIAILRDITERKKAEAIIRDSVEKYRTIFENVSDGIIYLDMDGNVLDVNSKVKNIFGYDPEDLKGKHFATLGWFDKEELVRITKLFIDTVGSDKPMDFIKTDVINKQGIKVPAEVTTRLIKKEGKIEKILCMVRDITERKKAEDAIRESEEKYRVLAETSSDGIFTTDMDGNLTYANPALEKMFGIPFSESKGTHFSKYITKESIEKSIELFMKLLRGESTSIRNIEFEAIHKDKYIVPIEVSASSIIKHGKFEGIECIARDITQRKKAEEKIKESEAKWRSLVENSPDIIMTVDRDGKLLFINHTVLGITQEQAIGKSVYDFVPSEYQDTIRKSIEKAFKTGEIVSYELAGIGPHGTTSWYTTRVVPIKQDKYVTALTLVSTDITKRKKMENALRESEEKLKSLFEAANDAVVYIDSSGTIIAANKKTEELFGYKLDMLIGKNFADLSEAFDPSKVSTIFKAIISGNVEKGFEIELIKKDGSRVPTEVNFGLIKKEDKIIGISAVIRDITERKRIQEEEKKVQEALRESEGKLSSLFDAIEDGIVYVDASGNFVTFNKRLAEMFGYKREELIGKNFVDVGILDPKYIQFFTEMLVRGEAIKRFEIELIKKDGSKIPTEISASTIRKEGNIVGFSAVVRNISERKKTQNALRESEEKLKAIFESVDDAIVYLDMSGNIIAANKKTEELFGYKLDMLIGKNFADIKAVDPNVMPRLVKKMSEVITTGEATKGFELTLIKNDGNRIPVEASTGVIKKEGKIVGLTAVVRDITERKKIEDEEKKRTEELERFTKLAVGRELKMIELKGKIRKLEEKLKNQGNE